MVHLIDNPSLRTAGLFLRALASEDHLGKSDDYHFVGRNFGTCSLLIVTNVLAFFGMSAQIRILECIHSILVPHRVESFQSSMSLGNAHQISLISESAGRMVDLCLTGGHPSSTPNELSGTHEHFIYQVMMHPSEAAGNGAVGRALSGVPLLAGVKHATPCSLQF